MKPRIQLAESIFKGGQLTLVEHDGSHTICLGNKELMHSRANASESLLGSMGVSQLGQEIAGKVLIGGLGLGFTLKGALDSAGLKTTFVVAELIPEVIEWNRTHLKHLNGSLLDDPRVDVRTADVTRLIREAAPNTYDAILLDVDNGPVAMVSEANLSLYSNKGILSICNALKSNGRLLVWSAGPDEGFERRLAKAGLQVEAVPAKAHEGAKAASYLIYLAYFAENST